jgi:3-methylcrotonyl-CoA carboxylase alpha subunit
MFRTILIANRGEIAVRIARTAHRLGLSVVAVFSDADEAALHVSAADRAIRIGPAPARESYLNQDAIIAAAKCSGAEAIHPGYGFLAENPEFAEAVQRAGLTFIGPPVKAIRAMGLKDEAKRLMEKAGVPLLPGYHGNDQDAGHLLHEAKRIGFPVLIKPVAGGGGKGMRRVDSARDFTEHLDAARRQAKSAFGDDRVLIEKFLASARHIESQVLADAHGNVVHLFERDCSLQRRHQKVIEEAPAPGLTPALREAMGEAAVAAAKAVGYEGAGTVEWIAEAGEGLAEGRFYFMEMNTRLQVEHPVTEMITGLDLVELQLRVASGEPLPFQQSDLSTRGHAMEARLYAEDPQREFQPQTGRLAVLEFPPDVRVDSGVRAGDDVTPFYDPLLAKIIVHGETREAARAKLAEALCRTRVAGLQTNLAYLTRLLAEPRFAAGTPDTALAETLTSEPTPPEAVAVALLQAAGFLAPAFGQLSGFRLWGGQSSLLRLRDGVEIREFRLTLHGRGAFTAMIQEQPFDFVVSSNDGGTVSIRHGDRLTRHHYFVHANRMRVACDGILHELEEPDLEAASSQERVGGNTVVTPVPGTVRALKVRLGEHVARGETIAVVEAMKMEFSLRAGRDGKLTALHVSEGQQVVEGMVIAEIGEPDA